MEQTSKRDTDEQWNRPVKLLGEDEAVTFLQHWSRLVKAHACRAQPVKSTLPLIPENEIPYGRRHKFKVYIRIGVW